MIPGCEAPKQTETKRWSRGATTLKRFTATVLDYRGKHWRGRKDLQSEEKEVNPEFLEFQIRKGNERDRAAKELELEAKGA